MIFELGKLVASKAIAVAMEEDNKFLREVHGALDRYITRDWGEMEEEDKAMNDEALESGKDRIFAAYDTSRGKIWIITEWDRSATTVLFPEDY